jgi:hypothetical protein
MATVGVDHASIPADAAQTCARHCQSIGMRLSAVAIMAENVGCVCQHASDPATPTTAGELSAPSAGMATIAMQRAAEQQQQQRQQQQLQRPRR